MCQTTASLLLRNAVHVYWHGGSIFPATPATYCVPDPPHGWDRAHLQFAGGANTGFVIAHQQEHPGDISCMQYMQRADLPVTWALADQSSKICLWQLAHRCGRAGSGRGSIQA